jgi:hypothetical protein
MDWPIRQLLSGLYQCSACVLILPFGIVGQRKRFRRDICPIVAAHGDHPNEVLSAARPDCRPGPLLFQQSWGRQEAPVTGLTDIMDLVLMNLGTDSLLAILPSLALHSQRLAETLRPLPECVFSNGGGKIWLAEPPGALPERRGKAQDKLVFPSQEGVPWA